MYALAAVAAVVMLLTGGGLVAGRALLARYESSVTRDLLLDPRARDVNDPYYAGWHRLSGPLNFLLVGSDLRAGNPEAGQRSDSIVIVQTDRSLTHAHLISIPRDLRVEIPEFPRAGFGGGKDKINSAFEFGGGGGGGVQLLSATLNRLIGLRFDGAAVIDFNGFKRVIDLLGGVRLCVDTQVTSIHTGAVFEVGCRQMTGAQALDFSRQRYGLADGDFDRQRHQQQLLKAIFDKALSNGTTRNPIALDQFIRAVGQSLTLDSGSASITDLMVGLRGMRPEGLTGVRLPSAPRTLRGVSYVQLTDEADGLFAALRNGDLGTWAAAHPRWVNRI